MPQTQVTHNFSTAKRISKNPRILLPAVLVGAVLSVYMVPFLLPPAIPVYSQSYVVGYNNKLASVLLACLSGIVLLLSLRRQPPTRPYRHTGRLPVSLLFVSLFVVIAFVGVFSYLVYFGRTYGVEDFYFIPQIEKAYYQHLHLYTQIEFPYGKLLFYPPLWLESLLWPLGVSVRAWYYICLVFQNAVGIAMAYWVINSLPMRRSLKICAFFAVTVFSTNLFLGPQYTLMRSMLPVVSYLLFLRAKNPLVAIGVAAAGQLIQFYDSPEQAIAFAAALIACSAWRFQLQRRWIVLAPAAVSILTALAYLATAEHAYLETLRSFAAGAMNHVPPVSWEVFVLIAAVAWIVPRRIAVEISRPSEASELLIGLYAVALALLPAAFGAAGILHFTANGMMSYLLSLVAADAWQPSQRRIWACAVVGTYLLMFSRYYVEIRGRYREDVACSDTDGRISRELPSVLRAGIQRYEAVHPCMATTKLDFTALRSKIGQAKFEAPYSLPEPIQSALIQMQNFVPSRWVGTIDLFDPALESQKVEELRKVDWAIVGGGEQGWQIGGDFPQWLSIPVHYRLRHTVWANQQLANEIKQHWIFDGNVGNLKLYHKVD